MAINALPVIALLLRHGWEIRRRSRHGLVLTRQFPGEQRPRRIVVPDKNKILGQKTLGNILGPKQTNIGSSGLQSMLDGNPGELR
ncbi:MAG: type II toxin-antitoxin system HicA family toxin [Chloroflexi bacterium]|nr:type II toxin-antitoxin system HicA family toxin [Chloroflexota bacterium]